MSFTGSDKDVLGRYAAALEVFEADALMRLTADCPFLDPTVSGEVLALFWRSGVQYASNIATSSWPDGLDCEVISADALRDANANATRPSQREHVTPYIRLNPDRFSSVELPCPLPGLSRERWTLDRSEDFDLLLAVAKDIPPDQRPPSYLSVLEILDDDPALRSLNSGIRRNEGLLASEG